MISRAYIVSGKREKALLTSLITCKNPYIYDGIIEVLDIVTDDVGNAFLLSLLDRDQIIILFNAKDKICGKISKNLKIFQGFFGFNRVKTIPVVPEFLSNLLECLDSSKCSNYCLKMGHNPSTQYNLGDIVLDMIVDNKDPIFILNELGFRFERLFSKKPEMVFNKFLHPCKFKHQHHLRETIKYLR